MGGALSGRTVDARHHIAPDLARLIESADALHAP